MDQLLMLISVTCCVLCYFLDIVMLRVTSVICWQARKVWKGSIVLLRLMYKLCIRF